jgi:hypothetical protein
MTRHTSNNIIIFKVLSGVYPHWRLPVKIAMQGTSTNSVRSEGLEAAGPIMPPKKPSYLH